MKTQLQIITEVLERDGRVSRNFCLSRYISRLASRIDDLERDGWQFETKKEGGDFVYVVVSRPKPRQLVVQFSC